MPAIGSDAADAAAAKTCHPNVPAKRERNATTPSAKIKKNRPDAARKSIQKNGANPITMVLQSMQDTNSAFWNFSLRVYARAGVPAACLEIQEAVGADVNVVLFLLYLATQRRALNAAEVAALDAAVAPWRDAVVRPLRSARRHLKDCGTPFAGEATAQLRSAVKRDELAAEQLQQLTMEALFPTANTGTPATDQFAAARANLENYAALTGRLPPAAVKTLLDCIEPNEQTNKPEPLWRKP